MEKRFPESRIIGYLLCGVCALLIADIYADTSLETVDDLIGFAEKILKDRQMYSENLNVNGLLSLWNEAKVYDYGERVSLLEKFGKGKLENTYPVYTVPEIEKRIERLLIGIWQFEHREWDPLYRDERNERYKKCFELYDKSLEEYGRVWGKDWIEYSKENSFSPDDEGFEEKFSLNYALLSFNPNLFDYYWFEPVWSKPNYKPLFLAYSDPEKALKLILRELSDIPVKEDEIQYSKRELRLPDSPLGLELEVAYQTLEIIWKQKKEIAKKYQDEIIQFLKRNKLPNFISDGTLVEGRDN